MMRTALIAATAWVSLMPLLHGAEPGLPRELYIPGEVLVLFEADTPGHRIDEILTELGIYKKKYLGMPGAYTLGIPPHTPLEEVIRRIKAYQEVKSAEPNYITFLDPSGRRSQRSSK